MVGDGTYRACTGATLHPTPHRKGVQNIFALYLDFVICSPYTRADL